MTVVLITLVIAVAGVYSFGPPAGPYNIVLKEIKPCEDEGKRLVKFSTKILSAGNGVYKYYGPFLLMVPWDEDVDISVELYPWGNGGFKLLFSKTFRGCKSLWNFSPETFNDLSKYIVESPLKCPLSKGNYTLKNWDVSIISAKFPVLHYNKYKFVIKTYYKKEKVGCHIFIVDVVPKSLIG